MVYLWRNSSAGWMLDAMVVSAAVFVLEYAVKGAALIINALIINAQQQR
jgi:hypothetical protein